MKKLNEFEELMVSVFEDEAKMLKYRPGEMTPEIMMERLKLMEHLVSTYMKDE